MIKKEIPYPCNSKQENKCCCSIIYPSFFHIISPTNTSRLYRKRIATSTLKRHRIRRTVELVAALGTRADLHRRRLRLPRLQELQSLHTQRVVRNVHQTSFARAGTEFLPVLRQVEKLEEVAPHAVVEGVVEAEPLVLQVADLVGVRVLVVREVLQHVGKHLTQLDDIIQKLD